MTLRRGFKAEAERTAAKIRSDLGLEPHDPVDIAQAAKVLDVRVVSAAELVDIKRLEEIEAIQAFAFSACTFEIRGSNVIVFNPLRSTARSASDIAHEISHLLLEHELTEIQFFDGVPFRTCVAEQEEEATALGGTILLPRPLLLSAARSGSSVEALAERTGVTIEMARFRWNTTGVARQVKAGRKAR